MKIKELTNDQISKHIKAFIEPRVGAGQRLDLQGNPTQIYVEFCGWSIDLLASPDSEIQYMCDQIQIGFSRSFTKRPNFLKRFWKWLKRR